MSDRSLAQRWQKVRSQHRAALIPYLTAGYPTRDVSLKALRMLEASGADIVEVGMPFSDPLADGPVIQRSTQIALEQGMTVGGTLQLVREARLGIPVIAFGYLNPVLAYGIDRFLDDAREAGVSGLLLTDLPAGEDGQLESRLRDGPLDIIRLIAPNTPESRLDAAVRDATGFIYLIARLGVTGPETPLGPDLARYVSRIRRTTSLPVALGFGIANGPQAARAAEVADGVVVGSALVKLLEQGLDAARDLMHELTSALGIHDE